MIAPGDQALWKSDMSDELAGGSREVASVVSPAFERGSADGHMARRLIDGKDLASTDPFILMAEDWMPRDAFQAHPHRGIETVTLVLDGALEHSDSAGHGGVLKAGDAQWMTAGRGVTHNENTLPGIVAHTLQLWVNLPAASKMTEPRYQDLRGAELPVRREEGVEVRVLSGRSGNVVSPTLNHLPVTAIDARLDPDSGFEQTLSAGANAFVLVLEGEVVVGDLRRAVAKGELAWLDRGGSAGQTYVAITAGSSGARVTLFAARPLLEPIVFEGPFVMNTEEEIRQAYADYRAGRF